MNQQAKTRVFSDTFLHVMFYLPFFLVWAGFANLQTPIMSGIEAKYITAGLFFAAAVCWISYAAHELYTGYKPKKLHW